MPNSASVNHRANRQRGAIAGVRAPMIAACFRPMNCQSVRSAGRESGAFGQTVQYSPGFGQRQSTLLGESRGESRLKIRLPQLGRKMLLVANDPAEHGVRRGHIFHNQAFRDQTGDETEHVRQWRPVGHRQMVDDGQHQPDLEPPFRPRQKARLLAIAPAKRRARPGEVHHQRQNGKLLFPAPAKQVADHNGVSKNHWGHVLTFNHCFTRRQQIEIKSCPVK